MLGVGTRQTGQYLDIEHDWRHATLIINESGCVSQGLFLQHPIHPGGRTHCRRKTKQGGTTTSESFLGKSREAPSDDFIIPRQVYDHSNWTHDTDAACWVKMSRAQDQGLRFWQTKSSAIIVHNPVPADCIHGVISQNGDRTLFERLSTPPLAPKVTLRSNWH